MHVLCLRASVLAARLYAGPGVLSGVAHALYVLLVRVYIHVYIRVYIRVHIFLACFVCCDVFLHLFFSAAVF